MRTNEDLHQNQNAHSEHSSNAGSPAGQTRRQFLSRSALGLAALAGLGLTACQTKGGATAAKGTAKKVDSVDGTFQYEKVFPVLNDNEAFDDSLVTNQLNSFVCFAGQGTVYVKSSEPQSFALFVNGHQVPTDKLDGSSWNQIDISDVTVNGDNRLQVSTVKETQATFEVKIGYPTLIDGTKDYADNDNFKLIDQIINAEIANGFTSAQLVVTRYGKIIKKTNYGNVNSYNKDGSRIKDGKAVDDNTLYDLASNTKMYATNLAIEKLVTDGQLDVSKKVQEYIPDFKDQEGDKILGKNDLTVREILEHQAGFPPDPQYHNRNYNPEKPDDPQPNANQKLYSQNRDEILQKIIETPLQYVPGTKTAYSDVDYMLLGFIIEKITNKRLDQYVKEALYEPLGLKNVTFNPLDNGFKADGIAATELNGNTRDGLITFDNMRTDTIQGTVHDEKAFYAMGGISGHAGLFANASDLAVLVQTVMNRGGYGNTMLFSEDVHDQFIKPKDTSVTYGLGWRRKGHIGYQWAFSPIANAATVGHTGWTGTLTVIDVYNNTSLV
ncbi:MAG: penicillin binding protein PBP4B, partial [Atopobium sp.]|nr:penicillin binding protein PBP4B [Atopobium sp.]